MKSKSMRKMLSFVLLLSMVFGFSVSTYAAEPQMTVEEARQYLKSYNVTKINSEGEEYSTQYIFKSDEDLEKAATYISENGLSKFNEELNSEIKEVVSKEPEKMQARTTTPSVSYATVYGNGTHTVKATTQGLATFDTLGSVEYKATLQYRVTASNGVFTAVSNPTFDIPYISAGGSWGKVSLPSYYNGVNAGVTANYTITKTVSIPVGNFSVDVKSETDKEVFALSTTLK